MTYDLRTTIKGQALADFIVKCMGLQETPIETALRELWKLYIDGFMGIILITPSGYKFHSALRFEFEASNNTTEYEALLAGLRMAVELKAKAIHCYSDSQLVINQVRGEY